MLVVDDDAGFRSLARRVLSSQGLNVVGESGSADGGRELATQLRPDAVLLDVRLPDGDGVHLAAELKVLPWGPRLLLTSSDPDAARRSAAAGLAFVPKVDLPEAPLRALLGGAGA